MCELFILVAITYIVDPFFASVVGREGGKNCHHRFTATVMLGKVEEKEKLAPGKK